MPKRVLPHKTEGFIEKPFYTLSPEDRKKEMKEMLTSVQVSPERTERRRKILMEMRGQI